MLTPGLRRQLIHIQAFVEVRGRFPSARELARSLGEKNHNTVWCRNRQLVERGYLASARYAERRTRGMVLLRPLRTAYFRFDGDAKALVPFKCKQSARAERTVDDSVEFGCLLLGGLGGTVELVGGCLSNQSTRLTLCSYQ